jgi:CheY-like chemotaxis protein
LSFSVVVVEPDRDFAAKLNQALEAESFRVNHLAGSGTLDILLLRLDPNALIMAFPGREIAEMAPIESFLAAPDLPSIPVIILIERNNADIRRRARLFPRVSVLSKPVTAEEVVHTLRHLLIAPAIEHQQLAESAQASSEFSGDLAKMAPSEIGQFLSLGQKTCNLVMRSGDHEGRLFFKEGGLIFARCDGQEGNEAAIRLLTWQDGSFQLEFDSVIPSPNITRSFTILAMEAMRRLDEARRGTATQEEKTKPKRKRIQLEESAEIPLPSSSKKQDKQNSPPERKQDEPTLEDADDELNRILSELREAPSASRSAQKTKKGRRRPSGKSLKPQEEDSFRRAPSLEKEESQRILRDLGLNDSGEVVIGAVETGESPTEQAEQPASEDSAETPRDEPPAPAIVERNAAAPPESDQAEEEAASEVLPGLDLDNLETTVPPTVEDILGAADKPSPPTPSPADESAEPEEVGVDTERGDRAFGEEEETPAESPPAVSLDEIIDDWNGHQEEPPPDETPVRETEDETAAEQADAPVGDSAAAEPSPNSSHPEVEHTLQELLSEEDGEEEEKPRPKLRKSSTPTMGVRRTLSRARGISITKSDGEGDQDRYFRQVWFVPEHGPLAARARAPLSQATVEALIRNRQLHPRCPLYRQGRPLAQAYEFPELEPIFRELANLEELLGEEFEIPERALNKLRHRADADVALSSPAGEQEEQERIWRLPYREEFKPAYNSPQSIRTIHVLVERGVLRPSTPLKCRNGPAAAAGSFSELEDVFREHDPAFKTEDYPSDMLPLDAEDWFVRSDTAKETEEEAVNDLVTISSLHPVALYGLAGAATGLVLGLCALVVALTAQLWAGPYNLRELPFATGLFGMLPPLMLYHLALGVLLGLAVGLVHTWRRPRAYFSVETALLGLAIYGLNALGTAVVGNGGQALAGIAMTREFILATAVGLLAGIILSIVETGSLEELTAPPQVDVRSWLVLAGVLLLAVPHVLFGATGYRLWIPPEPEPPQVVEERWPRAEVAVRRSVGSYTSGEDNVFKYRFQSEIVNTNPQQPGHWALEILLLDEKGRPLLRYGVFDNVLVPMSVRGSFADAFLLLSLEQLAEFRKRGQMLGAEPAEVSFLLAEPPLNIESYQVLPHTTENIAW